MMIMSTESIGFPTVSGSDSLSCPRSFNFCSHKKLNNQLIECIRSFALYNEGAVFHELLLLTSSANYEPLITQPPRIMATASTNSVPRPTGFIHSTLDTDIVMPFWPSDRVNIDGVFMPFIVMTLSLLSTVGLTTSHYGIKPLINTTNLVTTISNTHHIWLLNALPMLILLFH